MTIRLLLADDHTVVRQGLRMLLSSQPDLSVVGEAADGVQAVRLAEQLRPDVLLVDLMMPGLSGLDVIRQVSGSCRALVLSMHNNEGYVREALRSGALGYVLKDSSAEELVCAVRAVAAGKHFLGRPFSERSLAEYMARQTGQLNDPLEALTRREREVLVLSAQGRSAPEIGAHLGISARTVEAHRANLMHKLGLHSQAELIHFAVRRNLLLEYPG